MFAEFHHKLFRLTGKSETIHIRCSDLITTITLLHFLFSLFIRNFATKNCKIPEYLTIIPIIVQHHCNAKTSTNKAKISDIFSKYI